MKSLLLILILALLASFSKAQKFEGSLYLALNAAQIDGDDLFGYNKPGVFIGFGTAYPFNKTYSIAGAITYSSKGASRRADELLNPSTRSFNRLAIRCIETPITMRAEVKKWMFEAGLGFGFLISARADDGVGYFSYTDQLDPVELYSIFGAGYEFDKRVTGFIRWQYSVFSIAKGDNNHVFQIPLVGLYNNWFTMGAFWTL